MPNLVNEGEPNGEVYTKTPNQTLSKHQLNNSQTRFQILFYVKGQLHRGTLLCVLWPRLAFFRGYSVRFDYC